MPHSKRKKRHRDTLEPKTEPGVKSPCEMQGTKTNLFNHSILHPLTVISYIREHITIARAACEVLGCSNTCIHVSENVKLNI